ncbi:YhfZ family protein [Escherichia coli]
MKTIDELANKIPCIRWPDAGRVENAGIKPERYGLNTRGRNGSYLVEMDNKALLSHVDINNVVCAMPLPYTRLYEGLAAD